MDAGTHRQQPRDSQGKAAALQRRTKRLTEQTRAPHAPLDGSPRRRAAGRAARSRGATHLIITQLAPPFPLHPLMALACTLPTLIPKFQPHAIPTYTPQPLPQLHPFPAPMHHLPMPPSSDPSTSDWSSGKSSSCSSAA